MNTTNLTYIYAVTQPTLSLTTALTTLRGIAGASLRLLPPAPEAIPPAIGEAQLVFVAADVPEHDFNETALKTHFEDLDWLEDVARTHHDIVQAVAAHATVLPLRLATVYQDDHSARQALALGRPAFSESMDQLRDHTEYGVKIYLAAPTGPDLAPPPAEPRAPTAGPGKAYLRARRTQHHAREAVHQQAQHAAATVEAIAARHTTRRVRHAPQRGALTGPEENVLNDAYLIPNDQAEDFQSAIDDAAQGFPDLRVEVTGPWAPYSFVTLADAPDPNAHHESPP
ncbi:GvpL/GvpF family gas vesicle protein [Streptomyces sp. NPDC102278]|uniref:GvpL/GvpF family gas vesicle protein n=1 Tax=Streptomyces sp. NPDC102278 TaxID=3366152 RepID=UPI0038110F6D